MTVSSVECRHCGEHVPLKDAIKWPDGVVSLICPACRRASLVPREEAPRQPTA